MGTNAGQRLPRAFLDDVRSGRSPVLWLGDNLGELATQQATLRQSYGWTWAPAEAHPVRRVVYKQTQLSRDPDNAGPIAALSITDPKRATVLATAIRDDGKSVPWETSRTTRSSPSQTTESSPTTRRRAIAATDPALIKRSLWLLVGVLLAGAVVFVAHDDDPRTACRPWSEGNTCGGGQLAYDGYGTASGVRDGSGWRFQLVPGVARSAVETPAGLALSTRQFGDVEVSARLTTRKQLRQPRANPWEVAWLV